MFKKRMPHPRRKAFTLVEIAIVLGVVGSIASAIWWAASNAGELQKENNAVTEVQTIVQNMNNTLTGHTLSQCSGSNTITQCMIAAQIIPSAYFTAGSTTTADNPWNIGGTATTGLVIKITGAGSTVYQMILYSPSTKGCIALLEQLTSCQAGQIGCPTAVYTANQADKCIANQTNCPNAAATLSPNNIGWQSMTPTVAATMCAANTSAASSVEFDYSLQ